MVCVTFRVLVAHVLTRRTFQIVILLVSAGMIGTLWHSIDIKNKLKLPNLFMYYNISLNKDLLEIHPQTNDAQIHTSLVQEKVNEHSETDIVYNTTQGIELHMFILSDATFLPMIAVQKLSIIENDDWKSNIFIEFAVRNIQQRLLTTLRS